MDKYIIIILVRYMTTEFVHIDNNCFSVIFVYALRCYLRIKSIPPEYNEGLQFTVSIIV